MLMLLFQVGKDSYAIDTSRVVEVIPGVSLRKIPYVPDYVAGLFNYRGTVAPVIDLCHLIQGTPSRLHLSTRIIIVRSCHEDRVQYLGLRAEQVIETLNKSDDSVSAVQVHEAPYLGGMILGEKRMIQRVYLERLFTDVQGIYLSAAGR